MPNGNQFTIGEALNSLMHKLKLQDNVTEHQVKEKWTSMMSPAIINRTSKIVFRKGILFLYITSSPLKHELFMARETMKQRMNEEFGKEVIQQIIFK